MRFALSDRAFTLAVSTAFAPDDKGLPTEVR